MTTTPAPTPRRRAALPVDDRAVTHLLADIPREPETARERLTLEAQRARRLARTWGYGATRPRCADPLFILCQPRTGSTLVFGLLNRTPGTSVASEVLHRRLAIGPPPIPLRRASLRHVDMVLRARRADVVGAKLHLEQLLHARLDAADLVERWPRARFLVLYRASLLEQYLSMVRAKQTGQWQLRTGETARGSGPITVDVEELRSYARVQRELYEWALADAGVRAAASVLRYEDLADDPVPVLAAALEPLGIDLPGDVVPPTVRQATGSVGDRIANPDALDLDDPELHLDLDRLR